VRVTTSVPTGSIDQIDGIIGPELRRVVDAAGGGEVVRFAQSSSLAPSTEPASGGRLTILASRPGIEGHASLAGGRWAVAGATPREATLSTAAAAALGVATGDTVTLADRVHGGIPVDLVVVGLYEPNPEDPYWLGTALDLRGTQTEGAFTTVGPFVVPEPDLVAGAPGGALTMEWRAVPALESLTAEAIAPLAAAVDQLQPRLVAALPPGINPRVQTDLSAILGRVDRSVLVGRSGVLVLVLEFAVVAAYAIVLVAGMLADRRRAESALIRTRGGSSGHLAGMAFVEAFFLAGTAALIAPWVSLGVLRALGGSGPLGAAGGNIGLSPSALVADGLAAFAGIVAMTLPNVSGIPNLAGVRAAISRSTGRTLGQRLGLDLALVTLAAIALWQLRLYGAPLTRNARGVLGVDPLLVAAPGIGLLAGALLATRLLPRFAEVMEPILARGRGLVGAIGGRAVARRPLRYTRSALLLMLAAALGTFATAHVATWARSQSDQAAYRAGADVRIASSSQLGTRAGQVGTAYRALSGVTAAIAVDRLTVDSGRSVRGAPALALDGEVASGIVARIPGPDGAALPAALTTLSAGRELGDGIPLPTGARRIAMTIDADLTIGVGGDPFESGDLTTDQGLRFAVVVEDAEGRLHRFPATAALFLSGEGQRVSFSLLEPGFADPPADPRAIRAIEIGIVPSGFYGVVGSISLGAVEVATDAASNPASGPWATLIDLGASGAGWSWAGPERRQTRYHPPTDRPSTLVLGDAAGNIEMAFGFGSAINVRIDWLGALQPGAGVPVPILASDRFLELTAAQVGDTLPGAILGSPLNFKIVGRTASFPSLDPSKPFVVLDGPTLVLARYAVAGSIDAPNEWWLSSGDPEATAAGVANGPDPAATVTTRAGVERGLRTDPVALGVIGLLGLGSLAAMAFAAIGFVVNATVSTAEREGELALLRALGLSGGQLSAWLSLEHAFLLVAGLGGGIGLGVLLAWLVLPFSTLTTTGEPAVPTPVVVVPPEGLLPIAVLALLVFVVTLLVLRRQLLGLRIGNALRARDE
jgi:hypothetical protein